MPSNSRRFAKVRQKQSLAGVGEHELFELLQHLVSECRRAAGAPIGTDGKREREVGADAHVASSTAAGLAMIATPCSASSALKHVPTLLSVSTPASSTVRLS